MSDGVSSPVLYMSFRVDVVICLSTTVRSDTLQDAKEQRVSVKCRKQLRVEEVEMVRSLTHSHSQSAVQSNVCLVQCHLQR